ncbi:uncharacterized protein LOC131842428 [Achroia grisella]|uniref:uncharacterized protein LOC131842428 n=1 Tax=Achroia grisella TaxID=688607 RepID=UPI0027D1F65F|nr:uncharacterized protein LOC131842428 [Achroia grisella]
MSEARGKGKYALLIHFFYVVAIKLFILKVVYGIMFYVLLTKGWHFLLWFVHFIKEKKHTEYIEHDHEPYYEHDSYHHYHGHYDRDSDQPYHGYGKPNYGEVDYSSYKKKIYDADGSYSIKS